ncbi:hypothetical protein MTQ01_22235 [Streptomyces sp. XM4193]|uniref:hypothetical protein n=1 Tax=Streptomyces sp. XM4193 TaxID=2929782 RepID=UPI001FF735DB|nr:hypothetical protein [Streptomyces sp. XM4193]MCK1798693.1 hypothetical protein [Streptomyces sp. XM4193]
MSVAQVAGSALAAVIAALIAGRLGVYGTIIGAGVISVVATTGGPLLQHLLSRTGEGVREQVRQQAGEVGARRLRTARPSSAVAARTRPRTSAQVVPERVDAERGQLTPAVADPPPRDGSGAAPVEPYGEARTHGTRRRGVRRALLPAVLVFVVAMGGITLYEALSGHTVSGGGGTSIGRVLDRGSGGSSSDSEQDVPGRDAPGQPEESGAPDHDDPDGSDGSDGDEQRKGTGQSPREEAPSTGAPQDGADNPEPGEGGSDGAEPTPVPTPGGGDAGTTPTDPDGNSGADPEDDGGAGTTTPNRAEPRTGEGSGAD